MNLAAASASALPAPAGAAAVAAGGGADTGLVSFKDVLDIVNPLQHIPLVSTIYHAVTGDRMGPVGEVLGGALYGGVIGAIAGAVEAVVTAVTGRDIGGNLMHLVGLDDDETAPDPAAKPGTELKPVLAEAAPASPDLADPKPPEPVTLDAPKPPPGTAVLSVAPSELFRKLQRPNGATHAPVPLAAAGFMSHVAASETAAAVLEPPSRPTAQPAPPSGADGTAPAPAAPASNPAVPAAPAQPDMAALMLANMGKYQQLIAARNAPAAAMPPRPLDKAVPAG